MSDVGSVAYDVEHMGQTDIFKRYMDLDINDYRFFLIPIPNSNFELSCEYEIDMKLKNIDTEKTVYYFNLIYIFQNG